MLLSCFFKFFIIYFREAKIMVRRKYTTFYLTLLKLAFILLKVEVYNAEPSTRGRDPLHNFFYKMFILFFFCYFFFWRCTVISDLNLNVFLNFNKLLCFHPRTHALCKSSETVDDMKLDSSSDTDSSSENTYSSSEEN